MQCRFEVLSSEEVQRIHTASMDVLWTVGIRVDYPFARELFRSAGAQVDEEQRAPWIAGQVDDVAAARLAQLDSLGHPRDRVRTEIRQERNLAQVPQDTLGIRHL